MKGFVFFTKIRKSSALSYLSYYLYNSDSEDSDYPKFRRKRIKPIYEKLKTLYK